MFTDGREGKVQQVERSDESHAVIRFETSQANRLAHVLSRVSHKEPRFTYTLPDEKERSAALPRILGSAIRVSHLSGETYTTPDIDGGALWIAPGRTFTLQQLTGPRLPSQSGTQGLECWVTLSAYLAQVRQQLAGTHHWYLIALGVEPSKRRRGIGGALIQPVLSRADADCVPCYVETFQGTNLSFYEEHGFRIEGSGCVCGSGPVFWAMVRLPRRQPGRRVLYAQPRQTLQNAQGKG